MSVLQYQEECIEHIFNVSPGPRLGMGIENMVSDRG